MLPYIAHMDPMGWWWNVVGLRDLRASHVAMGQNWGTNEAVFIWRNLVTWCKRTHFWRSMILLSKNATQKNMVSVNCVLHFDPHPFAATFPEERRCHRILWHGSSSTIDNRRHGDDRWGTPLWIVFLHGHGDYPLVMTKSLRTWSLAQSK